MSPAKATDPNANGQHNAATKLARPVDIREKLQILPLAFQLIAAGHF